MTSRSTSVRLLAFAYLFALVLWAVPGSAAEEKARTVSDDWCGFSIKVSEPWQKTRLKGITVPGVVRCAWSGPNKSSVVIFLQEPGIAVSPRAMLDGSVKSVKEQLSATVSVQELRRVGGMKAMWLVFTGKGTGSALDGKGDVKTTQHWVAVPRERDVLVLLLTCPEADYEKLQKSLEAAVGSLKLSGSQTAEQKAVK